MKKEVLMVTMCYGLGHVGPYDPVLTLSCLRSYLSYLRIVPSYVSSANGIPSMFTCFCPVLLSHTSVSLSFSHAIVLPILV